MATRTSRAVFGDITNAGDSVAALAGKKPLKSERKADDVDARDASNPQAVTEYVNDMRAAASALYRLFFAAAARAFLPRRPSAFVDGVASTAWAVAPQTADAPGVEMGLDARVPLGVAATRTVPHSRRHAHRYVHFREKELETSVSPTYMRQQAHINEKMRAILIDWLVEVHLKFKLVPETLYLTVNLIDRYLLGSPVERSNLQLVGVSALLLASKYEEIYPPELKDLVYITDKAYTQEQILGMEEKMVKALKYKMTIASVRAPRPQRFFFGWRRRGREMTTPSTRREYRRPDGVSTALRPPAPTRAGPLLHDALPQGGPRGPAHGLARLLRRGAHAPGVLDAQVPALDGRRVRRLRRAQEPGPQRVEPDAAPLRAVRRERPARLPQGHARRPPLDEGLARGREEEVLVGEVRHGRDDAAQGPGLSRRRLCVF